MLLFCRLENHSKTKTCTLYWTIIKPTETAAEGGEEANATKADDDMLLEGEEGEEGGRRDDQEDAAVYSEVAAARSRNLEGMIVGEA